jgi:AAA family ATP:ADP antiporter
MGNLRPAVASSRATDPHGVVFMTETRGSAPSQPEGPGAVVRPSPLDRVLGIVAEVRAGEGTTAVLLALALFLLLMAYYIIKPVREALILQHPAGAEYKSWLGAAIALLLLVVVPAYSKLADRLPRNRLVTLVTLFFASHLVVFYGLSTSEGLRASLGLSLTFFVWVGIFNMMIVAQLWSFANDVYDQERGKRLFTVVGLGASFGAIAGGAVKAALSNVFDIFQMLLVSALALVGVAVITQIVHRRESGRAAAPGAAGAVAEPEVHDPSGGFAIVLRHRYLLLIAAFHLVFSFVNTNGEYMFGKLVKAAAELQVQSGELGPEQLRSFIDARYNTFFTWTNTLSFVLQFVVVSRLIKRAGFGPAFLILPFISLIDGLAVAAFPVMGVLFVGKIAENSTDYSLNNTLRQMLWLPTTRDMKYKAKQAVDTFFVRMGDVASGAWVVVGASMLGLGVRGFALTNAALVAVWLWLSWAIIASHRQLTRAPGEAPAP